MHITYEYVDACVFQCYSFYLLSNLCHPAILWLFGHNLCVDGQTAQRQIRQASAMEDMTQKSHVCIFMHRLQLCICLCIHPRASKPMSHHIHEGLRKTIFQYLCTQCQGPRVHIRLYTCIHTCIYMYTYIKVSLYGFSPAGEGGALGSAGPALCVLRRPRQLPMRALRCWVRPVDR